MACRGQIHAAQDINPSPSVSSCGKSSSQVGHISCLGFKHRPSRGHSQRCHLRSNKDKIWRSF